jgi:hypothetical protein
MSAYYVYLLDEGDHIVGRRVVESPSPETVVTTAGELLVAERPHCPAAEIWLGRRMIQRVERHPLC